MKERTHKKEAMLSQEPTSNSSLFPIRTSKKKKWILLAMLVYIISPFDLIPDIIPLLGYTDDLLMPVLLFLINNYALKNTDMTVAKTKTK